MFSLYSTGKCDHNSELPSFDNYGGFFTVGEKLCEAVCASNARKRPATLV